MVLPHLEVFKGFPARGPEGINPSNINERAAAIECYLDLRLAGRPDAEVVWSNYKREIDRWHGALDHNDTYTRRFLEQSDESLRDGSYDTRKLEIVLSALIVEATALAVGDFAPEDGDWLTFSWSHKGRKRSYGACGVNGHSSNPFAPGLSFRPRPISAVPSSPQPCNLRVGPQLPLDIVTAGPEDDAGGAPGLELGQTFAQLLASACEGHLFGGGHVDERVVAV